MRLTVYTDYTLRVLMYLAVKYRDGGVATIDEMADAYGISRSHLTKIVSELAQRGVIETVRGRAGGARLADDPASITVGEVVRLAEKDFAVVECHEMRAAPSCAILPACNLKQGLRRAVDAFMAELDRMTLADAISGPDAAAPLLGLGLGPATAGGGQAGRTAGVGQGSRAGNKASRGRAAIPIVAAATPGEGTRARPRTEAAPAQRTAGATPAQRKAGATPAQRKAGATPAQRKAGATPAQRKAGATPPAQPKAGTAPAQSKSEAAPAQRKAEGALAQAEAASAPIEARTGLARRGAASLA